jgi:hypothetical protein
MPKVSKCGHCDGTKWEVAEARLSNSKFKISFIQCIQCGAPVGAINSSDIGSLLSDQDTTLSQIEYRLARIEGILQKKQ